MFAYVLSIDFKTSLIILSDEPDLMTTPNEYDLFNTTAFHVHDLSSVAEPFVLNTCPKQPRSHDTFDTFDLPHMFLSGSEPFRKDSISTISSVKPTVSSVFSDDEIANNYHHGKGHQIYFPFFFFCRF